MLYNIKSAYGHPISGAECDIGHVKDFSFEEKTGEIRYIVVDTGLWLMKRLVLLSPLAFEKVKHGSSTLSVNLTRRQIQDSPSLESHRPISRTFEENYHRHYGWPIYWDDAGAAASADSPSASVTPAPDPAPARAALPAPPRTEYVHLASTRGITGFDVQASHGSIGSVSSFMADDQTWTIRQWIISTGHWYAGRELLLPTTAVTRLDQEEAKVFVNMTKADIQRSEAHLVPTTASLHP